MMSLLSFIIFIQTIVHLPPPPPSKKQTNNLHNHCFEFLLGITVVPREIEDNGYAKLWGKTRYIMVYVKMVSEFANIKFCGKLGQNRPKMQFETTPFNPVSRSDSKWQVGDERVKQVQHNCHMILCIKQLKGKYYTDEKKIIIITSTNSYLSTTGNFLADSPYIDSCLNLSTTATFFSP